MAFQLRTDKKETENKTIRFPLPLIEKIESEIKGQSVSFSSFLIQSRAGNALPAFQLSPPHH